MQIGRMKLADICPRLGVSPKIFADVFHILCVPNMASRGTGEAAIFGQDGDGVVRIKTDVIERTCEKMNWIATITEIAKIYES